MKTLHGDNCDSGFQPDVLNLWTRTNVLINIGVLIVYLSIFIKLKSKSQPSAYKEYRRAVRRLSVIVLLFVFSWFAGLLGSTILIALHVPPEIMPDLQINVSFFTLLCYSQNYYVCIWRSSDYREAFFEQLNILLCRKSKNHSRSIAIVDLNTTTITATGRRRSTAATRSCL
ncbi:hypothetical protein Y032_0087g2053 [Ancylostoma ceylanicum]|uniref:G-protein coupled receptors family 1 profile domain-containing protein n=1 Tax=Ancylostoma ceylanicum TaxID=53326 RepID=A0A016TP75_9BILA|nr:hypothetical protein Y032_0087g2053 [Ancylostoma ceylanicum]